ESGSAPRQKGDPGTLAGEGTCGGPAHPGRGPRDDDDPLPPAPPHHSLSRSDGDAPSGCATPDRPTLRACVGEGSGLPPYWLLRRAARFIIAVAGEGDTGVAISIPRTLSAPLPEGRARFTTPRSRAVGPGKRSWVTRSAFACQLSVTSAAPRRAADTIWRAARRALIALTGVASPRLNQVNSRSTSPLKKAFTGEPVRISPGTTVVTLMP